MNVLIGDSRRECEWLFVSICSPCVLLATCPGCIRPLAQCHSLTQRISGIDDGWMFHFPV